MIYLASPYAHPDPVVMDERAAEARRAAAYWLKRGFPIFSPIAFGHDLPGLEGVRKDQRFWHPFNMAWLRASRELWVLQLPGWKESVGVADEIRQAQAWNIPVLLRGVP